MVLEPTNEDTVQCLFFLVSHDSEICSWTELCQQLNNTIKSLSKDYIWHKEEFQVYIPITTTKDTGLPIHLCSTTCFGDNVEDEWFITYLVLEISRQYKNLIIQITDNDGDFLLIEAANCLQSWITPENTENRVFIYKDHIHIISPEVVPLDNKIELTTALKVVNESPELTKASCEIEQVILNRIGKYPERLLENLHRAVVDLPSKLAALLVLKPSLVAPIVEAYINYDIIDEQSCKNIDFNDCVTIEVKFTKFLYAKLVHSKLINCVKHYASENDKKRILGIKLMSGYQMIMNKTSTDLFSTKDYYKYVNSLKQNGYFKNNLEGSKEYNHLIEKANAYYSIIESPISSSLSHNITQLLSSNDYKQIKDSIKVKYLIEADHTGDNEDWLNINPEQLNDLLLTRYGKKTKLKNNDVISPQVVTAELSSFLKQTSDFEGIEPDHNERYGDSNIEFEPDEFAACIKKMLNIISPGGTEDTISENSDDDYDNMEYTNDENDDCDKELKIKLQQDQTENLKDSNTILANIIQSMKEEKAATGPTSNLLRSMGLHKSEMLDSDDDVD